MNRTPPPKGNVRIVTSLGGDEIRCRLWIDGQRVGETPYLCPLLRKGEHALWAECPGWPLEEIIWPFPAPELQKKEGLFIELPIGNRDEGVSTRPMRDAKEGAEDHLSECLPGESCTPER